MSDSPEPLSQAAFNNETAEVSQQPLMVEKASFSGSGSEYFGIWIVNILLTILTLGIYSAWAKVRKTRYFYDNTHLAGSSFEYHGNPVAILKGRIIAIVLVVGYQLALKFNVALGLAMFVMVAAIFPWLIWKSLQFKLFNSSYRGIRFGFRGSLGKAYKAYLLMPFIAVITLYFGIPYAHQRIKKFQHDESRFGTTHFSFHAKVGGFYEIYVIGFLVFLGGVMLIGLLFGGSLIAIGMSGGFEKADMASVMQGVVFFILGIYFWMFMLIPLFITLSQNLIWNNTKLGDHQFHSNLKLGRTTFIAFTNVLGIILTFGLFTPFAQIRAVKNRVEAISLTPTSRLDDFFADEQQNTSAVGEGVSDLLDFDISL